ncbi:MAG: hypothetical protein NVS3B28_30020 [Candidatus Velthaea sp.]
MNQGEVRLFVRVVLNLPAPPQPELTQYAAAERVKAAIERGLSMVRGLAELEVEVLR